MSKFLREIKSALIEREVEDVYNKGINMYFPNVNIEHPFGCDGLITTKTEKNKLLKLIIEYKFEEELSSSVARAKVIIQVLYYLKKFENNGLILPNVVMVGDVNECFVFHTNDIITYLDEDINWEIAPSNAHKHNPDLILKLSNDENFNPFVFEINNTFSFKSVADKIINLANDIQRYVHVTEHNIATIFEYFTSRVIKNKTKISANDLVGIFMGVIADKDNYYQHPTRKNTLVTPNQTVNIDGGGFVAFFRYFNRNYTPQERNRFAEISDRLIEDTNRRNKGEFYTPTLFVDHAHKMLTEQFGEDWKEKYVVWDNCWGTGNLTRDYRFNELYASTLEEAELEIGKRYNPEATKFQYDFLNDDLKDLPKGLLEAFEQDKPIIFFINPPYATASNMGANERSKGKNACKTITNIEMVKNGMGSASNNLYTQFLYKIYEIKELYVLTNVNIGLFSPTLYLTGSNYIKFRNLFLKQFQFTKACVFQASHFADVANNWGISFSVWRQGETQNKEGFPHELIDNIDGEITSIGEKIIYNIDNQFSGKEWIKEPIKGIKVFDRPTMSNALNVKEGKNSKTKIAQNALGCYMNVANDVNHNTMYVSLFTSSDSSNANGLSILPENLGRICSMFSARKLILCDWINSKDVYLAPNTEHPRYKEFENDSIIYSLFNTSSNQSSLRQIDYKGEKWDIKNEFFWLSKEEMVTLANEHHNDVCYDDCYTDNDRYVYKLLQTIELSEEAQAVLNKASEIVRKSFKYRGMFNEEYPNYHINTWDAGWYQIKGLAKEYLSEYLKEFNELYKALGDKMRPMVYELGFLK